MIAVVIGLVSSALFYFSGTVAEAWPLAWIAYAPLLWLAYGPDRYWRVVIAVLVATTVLTALGLLPIISILRPIILGLLPKILLFPAILIAALLFAREAKKRLHPLLALLAFPAFVTGAAYVEWFVTGGDTGAGFVSEAYSQVEFPLLVQSAALFGAWSIVFLLYLFANGVALVLRERRYATALGGVTLCVFAANLVFGLVQFQSPQGERVRIGLAAQDLPLFRRLPSGNDAVVAVTTAYSDVVRKLAAEGATAVILPELIAVLTPGYRDDALAPLASTARDADATIVAGFLEINGQHSAISPSRLFLTAPRPVMSSVIR
jgi:apolipoprotein N-acyltransferase